MKYVLDSLPARDSPLSLRNRDTVGDFRDEKVGGKQLVNGCVVLVSKTDCSSRIGFRKNPFEGHGVPTISLYGSSDRYFPS